MTDYFGTDNIYQSAAVYRILMHNVILHLVTFYKRFCVQQII